MANIEIPLTGATAGVLGPDAIVSINRNIALGRKKQEINIKIQNTEVSVTHCPYCNSNFTEFPDFVIHVKQNHPEMKMINCNICFATFRRNDHLRRHMQCVHTAEKLCKCPFCSSMFNRQDHLKKHINDTHPFEDTFACRECTDTFNSYSTLAAHEASHANLVTRNQCPHCDALFKRRDHMLRHIKTLHLRQTVKCPVCDKCFKRKDHMGRHIKEKHQGYVHEQSDQASDTEIRFVTID